VNDDQPTNVRVFDRVVAAGLSIDRIEEHPAAGRIRVDGETVTDPYTPAPARDTRRYHGPVGHSRSSPT
jgi:hypothetical protein